MKTGTVYLVGAGPGDPGLITQKGVRLLNQAEVVVYDNLVDKRLLEAASPQAELVYVGKSGSEHTKEQNEINQILIDKAKEGKNVVRLKGGDPFVLGRGGEEAEALKQEGILFEIVPGISSAIAVPAYAGIPVTHREMASSFAVVTGHENPTKPNSSLDWTKLSTGVDTLVFLMGMQNLPQIVAKLIENGRPAKTPIAVIKEGTRPEQKAVAGTLNDIVAKVKKSRLTPPAVIVVGEVVRLREKLQWFDNRPLFGKRILVTRARHQASVLSQLLAEHGAQPVEVPTIDIQRVEDNKELDRAINNLAQYQWIIFTSVNGVEAFFNRLHNLQEDSRALHGLTIGVIGPATATALEKRGIVPDYCPTDYITEGILAGLRDHQISGKRFLLPRADIADKTLVQGLTQLGAKVDEITTYKTVPQPDAGTKIKELITSKPIDVITFTSSSTVSNFITATRKLAITLDGARMACIGPKTGETAVKAGLKVDIMAEEHTIPGLVAAIEDYFRKEN